MINTLLYLALSEGGVAMNFFYDHEDSLLRMLFYLSENRDSGEPEGYHVISAPGSIAEQILSFLRDRAGITPATPEGSLRYCYQRQKRAAVCIASNPYEVRIYFTDERPHMRTKGIPDSK
ncbi:MAG: hypothetical protein KAV00_18095 [Phycisphaerae bacterium]|nr:hypothetical protein [Phycisphaerae bacterium]